MKSREIQKFWKTGLGVLTVPFVPDAGNCTWLVSLLLLGLPRAACGWGGCQLPQAGYARELIILEFAVDTESECLKHVEPRVRE